MTERVRRTKAERFKLAAEKYASKALAAMKELEGLADRKRYEYSDTDVDQLRNGLSAGAVRVAQAFERALVEEEVGFKGSCRS